MPPRGNEGLDFTPIITHYLFLFTAVLSGAAWFLSFISQCIVTSRHSNATVGVLWFAIFLQLALIFGVLYTLATDSIAMHRLQISVFGSIALVFAVIGVNNNIYVPLASTKALATGWLLLAMVDILWVLYFTSEEDSLMLYLFNSLGSGGLSSPSRRRRTRTSTMMQPGGNGYPTNYASGVGSHDGYDTKLGGGGAYGSPTPDLRGQASFGGSLNDAAHARSINSAGGGAPGSLRDQATVGNTSIAGVDNGPSSPLMAGVGAAGSAGGTSIGEAVPPSSEPFNYKAKALYSYSANTEDPNEISFTKGEILEIVDKAGKWWQARKADGTQGIAPSNYLQII